MSRPKNHTLKTLGSYKHDTEKRPNTPPVGLVSTATDPIEGKREFSHDPNIEPSLNWAGKKEGMSFEVPNVSLHVHERIDPQRIIKNFLKKDAAPQQASLFDEPNNELPINKAIEFYMHSQDWSNRLIAGDSLLVMNSLLSKEGMAGKIRMVYMDPPYGIRYNSNFQPFINKRDVTDGKDDDLSTEPEMIKAFRDTWELGMHSYLTHMYDRLLLARDLLSNDGSIFVQINDENVHYLRQVMEEVFGSENFIVSIVLVKKGNQRGDMIDPINDYILWFAKDKNQCRARFHPLFKQRELDESSLDDFSNVELEDGRVFTISQLSKDSRDKIDYGSNPRRLLADFPGCRLFDSKDLTVGGVRKNQSHIFEYEGIEFDPGLSRGLCWKHTAVQTDGEPSGMQRLAEAKRLYVAKNTLRYKRYFDDFPFIELSNVWNDLGGAKDRVYVVQTNTEAIKRCLLMTTDPGDIVFDPTCGSGTTAYVAEQWGRRWITCDTSRVAIALAKQRLMTSKFDHFQLAHPNEGIHSGFNYKTIPHITSSCIANNEQPETETLYDQPIIETSKVRVTGPFTVEAVPCLTVRSMSGDGAVKVTEDTAGRMGPTANYSLWMDELRASGIRGIKGQIVTFTRLEPLLGTQWLQAEGETNDGKRAVICFGPDFGPLEQRQVEMAMKEARALEHKPQIIVFSAFQFDPEAGKDIDLIEWKDVQVLKAQMSADLFTSDLRKKKSGNQSYWLIGQPDIALEKTKDGKYTITLNGFDYYDPSSGEVQSHGAEKIAMWMLDTDYDDQSLLPNQVFFPMKDTKRDWTPLAKALNGAVDMDLLEAYTSLTSLSFTAGENEKIAVKIVDDRGIESLVIKSLS